jgi:putative ABC transport system permease protein
MKPVDVTGLALESLTRHKLRTVLTLSAVSIGVVSVLALAGVGTAAKRYVMQQFSGIGANLITVSPGRTESGGLGSSMSMSGTRPLTLDDAEALRHRVAQAPRVVPLSLGTAAVEYGNRQRDVYLIGSTEGYAAVVEMRVSQGRFLGGGDEAGREHVAVLGPKLVRELFGSAPAVGRAIRIAHSRFRVIGVLESKGMSMGVDVDDMALVPVGVAMSLLDQANLHHILVQASSADALPAVREGVRAVLVERHREEDFSMVTQDAMLATFRGILDALTMALAGIAGISLAVAGVGIMNVMLVSVTERTGEIGLFKSLGSAPRDILLLFLVEATVLALFGIVIGIALDVGLVLLARRLWPVFPLAVEPLWIAGVTVFALASSLLFAWLPARRAARLPPAAALVRRP